ncbi:MAG: hypothetical protein ACRENN_11010 [Candidatus Eiseniibacteriota bacterium]
MSGPMASHPLGLGHGRFGSGTSWLPESMALHHLMTRAGSWTLMGHGEIFAGGAVMNGPRGDQKFFAPNMVMLMAERNSGASTLWRFSGMFSADAVTVGGAGYPLLFQTGETWHDEPLKDHQHPHNVFSELSASVTQRVGRPAAITLYVAPVGEPALGPPAYPHRPVGGNDPLAPIGHHWQDATHISFGVATAGIETARWRVEGSTFNGREPGEDRAEIQSPEFDSFSGRVFVNPTSELSLQTSYGYLHSPEAEHPEHDVHRTSASAIWVHPLGGGRSLDATLVWGRNRSDREDFGSWLFEGQLTRERGLGVFTRLEYVEKNAEELVLSTSNPPGPLDPEQQFPLRQATLGAMYGLPIGGALSWGLGAQLVQSFTPRDLEDVYGENPGGWSIFLRLRPRALVHAMMNMPM